MPGVLTEGGRNSSLTLGQSGSEVLRLVTLSPSVVSYSLKIKTPECRGTDFAEATILPECTGA